MNADLAAAAAKERELRAQHYPKMIERGEIGREEARVDLLNWARIAQFIGEGQITLGKNETHAWRPLERAAETALRRREEECRAKPADAALALRCRNVTEIHAMLARNVAAFETERPVAA